MDEQAPASGPLPDGDGPLLPGALPVPQDDFELDEHFAWLVRELDAGRVQPPPESAIEGPAISFSLGDACDVDPELLVAMCDPDGLGGEALSAAFGQDQAADVLRPGPILAALTAQAVAGAGSLTDDELIGALQAARRMANLADYQQTVVIAEFARRRQGEFEAAKASGVPVGCRDGEFPGEELAMELLTTRGDAGARVDASVELITRLPRTLAAMEAGAIDLARACTIAFHTRAMTDADAARADEVLAAAAPGKRLDQLARKAAALELKLAPEAVAARKAIAKQDQRVEARREQSGNASLSGRELDTADVIASKAHIDAVALRLRDAGIDGTLGRLRALALTDLTQGRNPLDRINPGPAAPSRSAPPDNDPAGAQADPASDAAGEPPQNPGKPAPGPAGHPPSCAGPAHPGESASLPALINLLVPAGTLLGWSTAPGEAAGWGLLDAAETQALVRAASRQQRTRWCVIVVGPDGTAIAHGCATGQHPWTRNGPPSGSPPDARSRPSSPPPRGSDASSAPEASRAGDAPNPEQAAELLSLLRQLNVTLEPIAGDTCDHRAAEDRYVPSRKLRHLVRARNQLCTAPACNAQAFYCDLDHTVPYPGGPTCQCKLNLKCRRHHRTKQAPGWSVTQPTPGTALWTTPSGRTHRTTATA
jgi:hypothetical protein